MENGSRVHIIFAGLDARFKFSQLSCPQVEGGGATAAATAEEADDNEL